MRIIVNTLANYFASFTQIKISTSWASVSDTNNVPLAIVAQIGIEKIIRLFGDKRREISFQVEQVVLQSRDKVPNDANIAPSYRTNSRLVRFAIGIILCRTSLIENGNSQMNRVCLQEVIDIFLLKFFIKYFIFQISYKNTERTLIFVGRLIKVEKRK